MLSTPCLFHLPSPGSVPLGKRLQTGAGYTGGMVIRPIFLLFCILDVPIGHRMLCVLFLSISYQTASSMAFPSLHPPNPKCLPSLLTHPLSDKPPSLPDHGVNLTFAKGRRVCSAWASHCSLCCVFVL